MIVDADVSTDRSILTTSVAMYCSFNMKRVYYSAFSPIPHASSNCRRTRYVRGLHQWAQVLEGRTYGTSLQT